MRWTWCSIRHDRCHRPCNRTISLMYNWAQRSAQNVPLPEKKRAILVSLSTITQITSKPHLVQGKLEIKSILTFSCFHWVCLMEPYRLLSCGLYLLTGQIPAHKLYDDSYPSDLDTSLYFQGRMYRVYL